MGKYMRKAKTAGEVAVMELSQALLSGVRTRAKTLALQRLQQAPASSGGGSYLQLRSRRLEKPAIVVNESKRQKQQQQQQSQSQNPNPNRNLNEKEEKEEKEEEEEEEIVQEASFGENVLDFEGTERSTRESTPCSLIRDPDTIRTPGSTTRHTRATETNKLRHIPTAHEMDEFFAGAEEEQQRLFIEKYNFDPVNDKPLLGRFVWEKVDP